MISIIRDLLYIYAAVIFARVILSWFPVYGDSPLNSVNKVLAALTEPVLAPIRRALPQPRAGGVAFDFSPMIVLIGLTLIASLL